MILRSLVRDCLYLNWALPAASLPPAPEALRYEIHTWQDRKFVFASALLFRNEPLRVANLPFLRLSYPQFNLRLYVLDGEGVPSVLFRCLMVPGWVVPGARLVARQPACGGTFAYPRPSKSIEADSWRWRVRRGGKLVVTARQASPQAGAGPRLGGWEKTTAFFSQRERGYALGARGLTRIEASHRNAAVWPVEAELGAHSLLTDLLPLDGAGWPELHSAWLCPEIPFVFELGVAPASRRRERATGPVAADPAMFSRRPGPDRSAAA